MGRLGACSWSLQVAHPAELAEKVRAVGVDCVQLALDPLRTGRWELAETRRALEGAGVDVVSGMMSTEGEDYTSLESIRVTGGVRPDRHWPANLAAARAHAQLARELGLSLVSLHAGFLPHDAADPERRVMIERLRELADVFAGSDVGVALETGQEDADTLLGVLAELDHQGIGVNFDPANMILYDMGDPIESLERLAPHVRQIHVKDAVRTKTPGTWGEEVPVGDGEVDWSRFFDVVRARGIACDFLIEREAGEQRVADMRRARELVRAHVAADAADTGGTNA